MIIIINMEIMFNLLIIFIVFFIGILWEENKEYFILITLSLLVFGVLAGHFVESEIIYGIIFIIGVFVERTYLTYKGRKTKKPKSSVYVPYQDWVMKIIYAIILIFAIDIVSETQMLYNFLIFIFGILVSWSIKKLEKKGK